jgi:aminoglycoside phosphotransferase (APT) family kinase protein
LGLSLRFQQEPTPVLGGWEAFIYRFQLQNDDALPGEFSGPLVLRVYCNHHGLPRLQQEYAAQLHLHALSYPVAQPLVSDTDAGLFGGPFMIMKWVPGRTLLDQMLKRPWWIVPGPVVMAELHARLHQLPAAGFPAPPGPFLSRHVEEMQAAIASHDLDGLALGLEWLKRNRPDSPADPCIVHLDFHPINLMMDAGHCQAVLDWGDSDVGDRHADVAVTLMLIESVVVAVPSVCHRLAMVPGRPLLYRWYRRAYCRRLPLDDDRLRYYMAWAALRRLCRYGVWLHAGPEATGSKPTSLQYVSADRVDVLRRIFTRQTRVTVKLAASRALAPVSAAGV